MSELMSGIFVLELRGVSSDSESASVRESPTEIQPLEFAEIFTDFRRDELRVTVASARNTDVFLSCKLRVSAFVDADLRVTRSKFFLFSP